MFYGQYELDRVILDNFFKDYKNGFFVECGAFDGLTESTCKFFEESMEWKGINIEPTPYAFSHLVKNRPNSINENFALSNVNEKKIFTNAIHPWLGLKFGNGSISHTSAHRQELIDIGCKFEDFEVNCIKFKDLWLKHGCPQIDLFVLDVEGHEIEALEGIIEINNEALPKIFCIESTISSFEKIVNTLNNKYKYHSHSNHNAFFIKK